jgi:hypothetical protein
MASTQISVRLSDEQLAAIDAAIKRVHLVEDTAGERQDYLREAAATAARVEIHQRSLRTVVGRYRLMCRRSRPQFSPAEWRLICDACNGLWLAAGGEEGEITISAISLEVSDAIAVGDLAAKWLLAEGEEEPVTRARVAELSRSTPTPDDGAVLARVRARGRDLVDRLRALPFAGLVAVADVVELFWSRPDSDKVPGEEGWSEDIA